MKLLLVNLYPQETLARYLLSSYVLKVYLEKYLLGEEAFSVEVLDLSSKTGLSEICDAIVCKWPDWVGYSCYIWNIGKIIGTIKVLKERVECLHILGGPEISVNRAAFLSEQGVGDYYVIGEGEKKILNHIKYLMARKRGLRCNFPRGIAYRSSKGFHYTANKGVVDLDKLPSVYLSGAIEEGLYERQQAYLETQRGCKNRCSYCVYHKGLPNIAYYPLERIIEELDHLILEKQVFSLRIFDAVFTSNLERAKYIVKYLRDLKGREGLRLPRIYWEFVYNGVDEEFIKLTSSLKYRERICNSNGIAPLDRPQLYSDLLKDYTVVNCVGVQSFCREALRAVARAPVSLKKFERFMKVVQRYNIVLKLDIILGLPFETFESYIKGLESILPYLRNTDHILNVHRLQILPGSDLETSSSSYGIVYSEDAPHYVFSTSSMSHSELMMASKLTAVLFRIINSPLRGHFFAAKESNGTTLLSMLEKVLGGLTESADLRRARLVQEDFIDDDYWNDDIYREIPSQWLTEYLTR
ncbi:MAG: cobalamin-dependent protein [Deltaproteobacteria bacterium]|nr:cobalamin-dependent protein [Deltaproteobacteria bacterium]